MSMIVCMYMYVLFDAAAAALFALRCHPAAGRAAANVYAPSHAASPSPSLSSPSSGSSGSRGFHLLQYTLP